MGLLVWPVLLAHLAALPAAAAGSSGGWAFNNVWEMWLTAALLIALALRSIRGGDRRLGHRIPVLPPWVLLTAAGCLLFVSLFYVGDALPDWHREPRILRVKRAVGGWTAWTDTAHAGGDNRVLATFLGRDSGTVFLLETHLDKVGEYPRSFLCFNLYDSPEPQRYSDTAARAVGLEIHQFDAWTGQGKPRPDIHYDFTVKRREATWFIRGRLDGMDIGGTFEGKREDDRMFFPPSSWRPPAAYR